ncbi:hypothetical protein ACWCQK_18705 [Streptomyces sp. NPDC002306]
MRGPTSRYADGVDASADRPSECPYRRLGYEPVRDFSAYGFEERRGLRATAVP